MATQEQIDRQFVVIDLPNGKYGVVDVTNGKRVGFCYSNPPLYRDDEWGNLYSARGFCQKLYVKVCGS